MQTLTRTRKIGGSLVVTLPKNIVREEGILEDEIVKIKVEKVRRDYFGALKGIGNFIEEDRAKGQLD